MNKRAAGSRDAYFAGAESWASDRQAELRASRRIAWIVAGAAGLIAVCEALALLFLMPLKTVVPYTLLVDRTTGFVQAVKPLDPQAVTADAALIESFLVQYVIAREGHDASTAAYDGYKVRLWSATPIAADYQAQQSVLAAMPAASVINVQVKSVTPIYNGRNIYLVRFQTARRDGTGAIGAPANWAAVVRYTRSGVPMTVDERRINPLGFKVVSYRRSAETLPVPETPAQPAPTNSAPVASATGAAPAGSTDPLAGYPRTVPQSVPYR